MPGTLRTVNVPDKTFIRSKSNNERFKRLKLISEKNWLRNAKVSRKSIEIVNNDFPLNKKKLDQHASVSEKKKEILIRTVIAF